MKTKTKQVEIFLLSLFPLQNPKTMKMRNKNSNRIKPWGTCWQNHLIVR